MTQPPVADATGGGGQRASECREASGDADGVSDPFFLRLFSHQASHSSDVCGPLATASGEPNGFLTTWLEASGPVAEEGGEAGGCLGAVAGPHSPLSPAGLSLEAGPQGGTGQAAPAPHPNPQVPAGCGPSWFIEKGVKWSSTVPLDTGVMEAGEGSMADSPSAVSSP